MSDQIGMGEHEENQQDPPAPTLSIRQRRLLQRDKRHAELLALAVEGHAHWHGTFTGSDYEEEYKREMDRIAAAFKEMFGVDYKAFLPEK